MKTQEYAIPQTEFHPDFEQSQASLKEPVFQPVNDDAYMMKRYLERVEADQREKVKLGERQALIKQMSMLERVRENEIDSNLSSRRSRIDLLLDYMSLGIGSISKKEAHDDLWKKLVEAEAQLGGSLIPASANETHYFHYHDKNEWFWYAKDKVTNQEQTIRYKVDETSGIFKSINVESFSPLSDKEYANFLATTREYVKLITTNIYGR